MPMVGKFLDVAGPCFLPAIRPAVPTTATNEVGIAVVVIPLLEGLINIIIFCDIAGGGC